MKSWNKAGTALLAAATALLVSGSASQTWAAPQNFKSEAKCHATIAKAVTKHVSTVSKALSACVQDAIEAGSAPACPDAEALATINESATKTREDSTEFCQSTCSLSAVPCISSRLCPPNGTTTESCTAAGANFFDISRMGFPGPYCDVLSATGSMRDPEDFGLCAAGLGENIGTKMVDLVYGDLDGTPALSDDAQDCLSTIAKAFPKTATKMAKTVNKCRNKMISSDPPEFLPSDCATADPKNASSLAKSVQKLRDKIEDKCTESAVLELSLCGSGVGGTTKSEAQDCLALAVEEISHSGEVSRTYAPISITNAAYPQTASARCGDNLINQLPNQFALSGEECDGTELGSCAACLPPGDIFECTCAETRRSRVFADGFAADLDNGWTGASHNSKTPDGAGFVATVSGCDCTDFTGATCTGSSTDPDCNVFAETKPRCSHRVGDGTSCDEVGNENNVHTDSDCKACSAEALNADDFCTGTARYCFGGANDALRCNDEDDCPGGACSGIGRCADGPFVGEGCQGLEHCGVCIAGTNMGGKCGVDSDCGIGGDCEVHNSCSTKSCIGGANEEQVCDADADCPGGRCADTSDCSSRCYDANDVDQGPCWRQSDCADGERCRGICDSTNYCLFINNGAPLPLSSEGTSVCVLSRLFTNVTGTRNIQTGAHAINYELRSLVHLGGEGAINSVPCPLCGGWCAIASDTSLDRYRCDGQCSGPELECRYGPNIGNTCANNSECGDFLCGPARCRFDDDCPSGTCSGSDSPDCDGGDCRLDLACSVGPKFGLPCRIEAYTAFGTTSADCPPDPSVNYTGTGLAISWTPLTSGTQTLESPAACDATGYQNYDCNCVTGGGGTRTQPNKCAPACTDPDPEYFGRLCEGFTTCVGGSEAGAACDEDSDCSGGGTCTGNPRVCGDGNLGTCSVAHCVGGDHAGEICATNAQCDGVVDGICTFEDCTVGGAPCTDGFCQPDSCVTDANCEMGVTCEDVCPNGLCTPLCTERGTCTGGDRDGKFCALDVDCVGGGTCDNPDPEEGACAKGTFNHCDGPGWEFVSCAPLDVGTKKGCEWGIDDFEGGPNAQPGAGYCRSDVQHCFVNDGTASGGGDATNSYSVAVFCIPPSSNSSINATAGLPGPGRIRQEATVTINFDSLP